MGVILSIFSIINYRHSKSLKDKIIKKCIDLAKQVKYLNQSSLKLKIQVNELNEIVDQLIKENNEMKKDLSKIRKALGPNRFKDILKQANIKEVNQHERDNR